LHGSNASNCVGISGVADRVIGDSVGGGTHACFRRVGVFFAAENQIWSENASSMSLPALT
jgi:hypothetical protein